MLLPRWADGVDLPTCVDGADLPTCGDGADLLTCADAADIPTCVDGIYLPHMCRWCWYTQCVDYDWKCYRRCLEARLLKSTVLAPGFLPIKPHRINRHSIGHKLHLATYLYSSSYQGLYFLLAQLLISSRDIEGEKSHCALSLACLSIAGKFTTQSHRWTQPTREVCTTHKGMHTLYAYFISNCLCEWWVKKSKYENKFEPLWYYWIWSLNSSATKSFDSWVDWKQWCLHCKTIRCTMTRGLQ